MRLRPSGNAGPVATSLENFARYHEGTAQTWEQQALTRARVVAGDPGLAARIEARSGQTSPARATRQLWRARCGPCASASSRSTAATIPGTLKQARGGMVELEFTVQYLKLRMPTRSRLCARPTRAALLRGCGDAGSWRRKGEGRCRAPMRCFQGLQAVLRLSLERALRPRDGPAAAAGGAGRAPPAWRSRRAAAGGASRARAAARREPDGGARSSRPCACRRWRSGAQTNRGRMRLKEGDRPPTSTCRATAAASSSSAALEGSPT